jgi:UDP-2-acetamido-3-amino-2,3-dideoxy-glucuronate N-acetyltransferase
MSLNPAVKVHPQALVESESVGAGTRVWAFAHILPGARVGKGCNIGEGVFIEGRVVVGDDVIIKNGVALYDGVVVEDEAFLGPHAVFTNDPRPRAGRFKRPIETWLPTTIRRGAAIGANATVVCGVEIADFAMVAAGAVVTRDVPAYVLVVGSPARARGFVCACGDRLPETLACACGLRYRKAGEGLAPIA